MKIFFFISLLAFSALVTNAQEDSTVNKTSYRQNLKEFVNSIFMYPEFTDGIIILKDKSIIGAKLNYNRVLGQMLFIGRGKTLAFSNPDAIESIIIGNDTFNYCDFGYLKKVSHLSVVNLYTRQTLGYYIKAQSGIYGTPVINYGSSAELPYSSHDLSKKDDELESNSIFRFNNDFFIKGSSTKFLPATKSNIYNLFRDHESELNKYFQQHEVNFGHSNQVEKLLEYMDGISN
jgi:hypothetical protein